MALKAHSARFIKNCALQKNCAHFKKFVRTSEKVVRTSEKVERTSKKVVRTSSKVVHTSEKVLRTSEKHLRTSEKDRSAQLWGEWTRRLIGPEGSNDLIWSLILSIEVTMSHARCRISYPM